MNPIIETTTPDQILHHYIDRTYVAWRYRDDWWELRLVPLLTGSEGVVILATFSGEHAARDCEQRMDDLRRHMFHVTDKRTTP